MHSLLIFFDEGSCCLIIFWGIFVAMSTYWKDRLLVTVQFILMATYIIPVNLGHFPGFPVAGLFFILLGGFAIITAIWQLRHSISPFPSPKANANLIHEGVFSWVRHPIYTGILSAAFGYIIYTGSVWRSVLSLVLLILFQYKARYEEQLLKERFRQYEFYMNKTGRFLPKVS